MSAFHRPCDNEICIICQKKITLADEGCLITVPSKKLKKFKAATMDQFVFKWKINKPSNPLHFKCWEKHKKLTATEQRVIDSVEDTLERFCTLAQLEKSVDEVVPLLIKSKSTVCFTGAGISTSAGIPDYRGSSGIDNVADHANQSIVVPVEEEEEEEEDVDYSKLQPTFAHKALVTMAQDYLLHYVITQNCDNLHAKAGLPENLLSELHGNVFKEYCEKCQAQYLRDYCVDVFSTDCHQEPYYVKCKTCGWNHYTGRLCDKKSCRGKLRDTIVNFGDDLHLMICGGLLRAKRRAKHADVCLTLGTSLTVYPASDLPSCAKNLIIINLQNTDFDEQCSVRIYSTADAFFQCLMPKLKAAMPANAPKKRFDIEDEDDDEVIDVEAEGVDGGGDDDGDEEEEEEYVDDGEEEEEEETPKRKRSNKSKVADSPPKPKRTKRESIVRKDDEEEEANFDEILPVKKGKSTGKKDVIVIDNSPPPSKKKAAGKKGKKNEVIEIE